MCPDNEHNYLYAGVKYEIDRIHTPGSAKTVLYFDHHYCSKCLIPMYFQLSETTTTFVPIAFIATPRPTP